MENKSLIDKIKEMVEERFYSGPTDIIGIDFGYSSLKFAEVSKTKEGYRLNKFESIDLPEGSIIEDEIHKEDQIIQCLQIGLDRLDTSSKWVCFSLSGPNVIIKKLQLPGGSNEEIEDSVYWEIEQYLPFPIEDANVSFSVLGENQGGGVDVIVGVAKKSLVNNFTNLISRVGLKVKIIDIGVAALLNVIEHVEEKKIKNGNWLIIDFGAQKSEFIIYKNGAMVFSKEIAIGGLTITEEIQRQMGVNYLEAESLKIQGDGSGNIPEEILSIMNQVIDSFFEEIKKTIDFWTNSTTEEGMFEGCIVTGGSVQVPGFTEAVQDVFGVEVTTLNMFTKVQYNQKYIDENDVEKIVYTGSTAVGLAMREFKDK